MEQFQLKPTIFFGSDALAALEGGMTLDAAGVCVDDALNALYQLTGERAGDDVIDEVFSTFCVGK